MKLKGEGTGPLPPLLEQYVDLRENYPDYLVLFQVGDFYECFGEDAERLARALGLILTHKSSNHFVTPMAGIPIRAVDSHVERLLEQGIRVAIADQVENPLMAEGLVKRDITQLITPGTITEENLLQADANYLAAVATGDGYGLALLDISTGEFRGTKVFSKSQLFDELKRYRPAEVLLAPELESQLETFSQRFPVMLSYGRFDPLEAETCLQKQFGQLPESLEATALCRAAGAVLAYALETQQGSLPQVTRFSRYDPGAYMQLDEVALATLEVFEANLGPESHTLFSVLNDTRTAPGRRLLKAWLRHPLLDKELIEQRLDVVEAFVHDSVLRQDLRKALFKMHDLERLATRLSATRASARDLVALARSLSLVPLFREQLEARQETILLNLAGRMPDFSELEQHIQAALSDEPPQKITEGGLIKDGFDTELDALRKTVNEGRQWIAELELRERESTGIPTLKIGFNGVFGYYLEVTRPYYDEVPQSYRAVQTLKDRQRYTRPDLRDKEREILRATETSKKREYDVFDALRSELVTYSERVRDLAMVLAELDVYTSLAEVAARAQYCRPDFSETAELKIRGGRHAVVERTSRFIANDIQMTPAERFILLTGPNMSGKSTYLRQQALICLMAQIGSFVPAEEARLPLFKRIYTRIGANDDLAGGRSTFMVEMSELARILQQADEHSFILLDEIGRGTSTYDGLALAWAAIEHLHHHVRAYTLFATHYFELTQLVSNLACARNYHVAAKEEADGLVFYHQVLPGPASKSYGLEVAKLAGVPQEVLSRAQAVFHSLSSSQQHQGQELINELLSHDLSRLSPLEALTLLHQLQDLARGVKAA
ncbi:MAG: DNA mismatch repair protein MutS [Trueperaceae bacterium]|nr:DNA mismatch repair protein MutS [Trueperaceae bacterium]